MRRLEPAATEAASRTDDELLKALRDDREREAVWQELLHRYYGRLFLFVRGMVRDESAAEEIAHECLVELWKTAVVRGGAIRRLKPWLFKLAARKALRSIHERRANMQTLDEMACPDPAQRATSEACAEREELLCALHEQLGGLPERLRLPVLLHYGAGHSQVEIAGMLSCRQSTVSERIAEGLEKLRASLSSLGFGALATAIPELIEQAVASPPESILAGLELPAWKAPMIQYSQRLAAASGSGIKVAVAALAAVALTGTAGYLLLVSQPAASDTPSAHVAAFEPILPDPVPSKEETFPEDPWRRFQEEKLTIPGKPFGRWQLEGNAGARNMLRFSPASSKPQTFATFCYYGGSQTESTEWQGEIDYLGKEESCRVELGVAHPNRFNFSGTLWYLDRRHFPVRFIMQARLEERGCRLLIVLKGADGHRFVTHSDKTWHAPPWKLSGNESEATSPWLRFERMREFGFAVSAHDALRVSALEVRRLSDAHLIAPLD